MYAGPSGTLAYANERWTWFSGEGSVLCAQATDALVPPLTEWVNSDGETDPNWTLTQVDYEDKRKEYPAPLSLRLMEVDALQKPWL